MNKYFIGDPECLREMGFVQNVYKTYWFYRGLDNKHFIFIHTDSLLIEYSSESELKLINEMYEER